MGDTEDRQNEVQLWTAKRRGALDFGAAHKQLATKFGLPYLRGCLPNLKERAKDIKAYGYYRGKNEYIDNFFLFPPL